MSQDADTVKPGFFESQAFRRFIGGGILGSYLSLIRATSRLVMDPADHWQRVEAA